MFREINDDDGGDDARNGCDKVALRSSWLQTNDEYNEIIQRRPATISCVCLQHSSELARRLLALRTDCNFSPTHC